MRKVKVDRIIRPDDTPDVPYQYRKKYSFHPGDGRIFHYGSERTAKAAVAKYNRAINLAMVEMNDLLVELYALYRSNWFYFDGAHTQAGRDCRDLIELIEQLLSRSNKGAGSSSHFSIAAIDKCVSAGIKICEIIIKLQSSRSNYYELRLIQTKSARLQNVSERLNKEIEELTLLR